MWNLFLTSFVYIKIITTKANSQILFQILILMCLIQLIKYTCSSVLH